MALRLDQVEDAAPEAVASWHPSNYAGIGRDVGGERTWLPSLFAFIFLVLMFPVLTAVGYINHRNDPPRATPVQQTQGAQAQPGR